MFVRRATSCDPSLLLCIVGSEVRIQYCPARTGPLEGPIFPSEDRDFPYLASSQVKLTTVRQTCAKLGKSQGPQPTLSPFSSRMRAGQMLPLGLHPHMSACVLSPYQEYPLLFGKALSLLLSCTAPLRSVPQK